MIQASLRDAVPFSFRRPGVETPGYFQRSLRDLLTPDPHDASVPEGPLTIARQFHWRECATQTTNRVP